MDTRAREIEAIQRLIDLHFEIWNDTSKAGRIAPTKVLTTRSPVFHR